MSITQLIIVCAIFAILSLMVNKTIINPGFIFFMMWGIILQLNSMQLYYLKEASTKAYDIIGLGLISFGIGYILSLMIRKRYRIVINNRIANHSYSLNYQVAFLFAFILIIYNVFNFVTTLPLLLSGNGLALIRSALQDSSSTLNSGSAIMNAFKIFIARPIMMILPAVTAVDYFLGEKNRKLLILTAVALISSLLTTGGRSQIVSFGLYILICYILAVKKFGRDDKIKQILKKYKRQMILLVIGIAVILYWATTSRNSTIRTVYYYFAMEPVLLDQWMNYVDANNIFGYGMASINGFLFILFWVMHNFCFLPYPKSWYAIYTTILNTENIWQKINTGGGTANAYVTTFWYFYLDGRAIGVILGMFIYGVITAFIFSKACKTIDDKAVCLFCYFCYGLVLTFTRFPFANIYYALGWLYISMFMYKKKA